MLTNPRDAFTGQSRTPNMVPFDMLGMVSYKCPTVTFVPIRPQNMPWHWNPGQRSFEVIGTDTVRFAAYDFLLTFHSNQGPISYCFRDVRQFQSKIAKFSHRRLLCAPLKGIPLNWVQVLVSKNRMIGLPGRVISLTISSAVWKQYTNVFDEQKYGRADTGRQQTHSVAR